MALIAPPAPTEYEDAPLAPPASETTSVPRCAKAKPNGVTPPDEYETGRPATPPGPTP